MSTIDLSSLKFNGFIRQDYDEPSVQGFGLIFRSEAREGDSWPNCRAAIIFRKDWTPAEFGRALEMLGKALQTGEGVRVENERLCGFELNAAEFAELNLFDESKSAPSMDPAPVAAAP